jgi:hypothetical protein
VHCRPHPRSAPCEHFCLDRHQKHDSSAQSVQFVISAHFSGAANGSNVGSASGTDSTDIGARIGCFLANEDVPARESNCQTWSEMSNRFKTV